MRRIPTIVCALLFSVCSLIHAQVATTKEQGNDHDLSEEVKLFGTYSDDIQDMGKSITGEQYMSVRFLSDVAIKEEEIMVALDTMLAMHDVTQSASDRNREETLLVGYIGEERTQFDKDAKAIVMVSGVINDPALAQTALKMKDDIRAASDRMGAISDGLK
jgi:hypothetical protein